MKTTSQLRKTIIELQDTQINNAINQIVLQKKWDTIVGVIIFIVITAMVIVCV